MWCSNKTRVLVLTMALVLGSLVTAFAQHSVRPAKDEKATESSNKVTSINSSGPVSYSKGKRSPFEDPVRRPKSFRPPPTIRPFPSIEERLREYLAKRNAAKATGRELPSAFSAYLVSELEVNGTFKTKDGYGAFVRAKPTDTTFFVRVGDKAFNGKVVRIDAKQVVLTDAIWMTNGPDQVQEVTKAIQSPMAPGKQDAQPAATASKQESVSEQK